MEEEEKEKHVDSDHLPNFGGTSIQSHVGEDSTNSNVPPSTQGISNGNKRLILDNDDAWLNDWDEMSSNRV